MAKKAVYLYQVTMGHGDKEEQIVYCYARNSGIAVEELKIKYKEKKYDSFRAKMFGQADTRIHTEPFEEMTEDEVRHIVEAKLAEAQAYAQRQKPMPEVEFVPVENKEKEESV